MVAIAIAIVGLLGMLIVDYGLWNRPKLQTAENVSRRGGEGFKAVDLPRARIGLISRRA
jgi:hypothetical protein